MPRKQLARTFKVVFELELDPKKGSAWIVSIPSVRGCHSQGRSLVEARRNIREALSLFEEDFEGRADEVAANAVFEEVIRMPAAVRTAVRRWNKAREHSVAVIARSRAEEALAAAAVAEMLSLRDAGELLGLSPEGVRKAIMARNELMHTGFTQTAARRQKFGPAVNDNTVPPGKAKTRGPRRSLKAG